MIDKPTIARIMDSTKIEEVVSEFVTLKKRGIKKLKVVYSKEPPITPLDDMSISCRTHCICPPGTARKCTQRRQVPGSNAFVPAAVGLIVAGEVVKDLTEWERSL